MVVRREAAGRTTFPVLFSGYISTLGVLQPYLRSPGIIIVLGPPRVLKEAGFIRSLISFLNLAKEKVELESFPSAHKIEASCG